MQQSLSLTNQIQPSIRIGREPIDAQYQCRDSFRCIGEACGEIPPFECNGQSHGAFLCPQKESCIAPGEYKPPSDCNHTKLHASENFCQMKSDSWEKRVEVSQIGGANLDNSCAQKPPSALDSPASPIYPVSKTRRRRRSKLKTKSENEGIIRTNSEQLRLLLCDNQSPRVAAQQAMNIVLPNCHEQMNGSQYVHNN